MIYKYTYTEMLLKRIHILFLSVAFMAGVAVSCTPEWVHEMTPYPGDIQPDEDIAERIPTQDTRKVLLLYSAGFNSISSFLKEDIEDLSKGWLPSRQRSNDVVLVYSHQTSARGQYNSTTEPVLFRMYSHSDGTVIRDTLAVYESGTISASATQLNNVLTYVKENFPARSYGMIFSSHATGYLPEGFYSNSNNYHFSENMKKSWGIHRTEKPVPVPYVEPEQNPGLPQVKSIGQDVNGNLSYEIDIRDFAAAIPMKLDYLLFDACLMGGIEVAYELAGKCDRLGFSQAEVLAEGFNYTTLSSHLLGNRTESDPMSVCKDYFTQYDIQEGVYRSATISLIDCNNLEPLAETCGRLFEKYSDNLKNVRASEVQRYYRGSTHWFYDLESILVNAGISDSELDQLHGALEECILYKAATPSFMNEFLIHTFSGFSMYLPSNGHAELDKYYKTLKWNKITGLVK